MKRVAYDLIVIGAGSAGYAAALTAHDCGCSVAFVDPGPLGGLCILRGCMPSKALLASSDALYDARESGALGIHVAGTSADMPFIARRKRELVKEFAEYRVDGIEKFPVYCGRAAFLSEREVQVGDDVVLEGRRFIIATGSVPAPPVLPGLAKAGYLDSDAILDLERIPESVVVLGGGYTACELGQFLARMGAKTTVVIRSDHLLTSADDDVGHALTAYFGDEGIEVFTRATVLGIERRGNHKVVRVSAGGQERELVAEEIFSALGRVPNVAGLNLEKAGVRYDASAGIGVDATLRTSNPNIFAVGDVTGEYLLVHVAIYQGEVAARNATRDAREEADYRIVSAHAVFTDPQIGVVGASEKELERDGRRYAVGRYDFAEHGKAMCLAKPKGFVKMMAALDTGEILGAAAIGAQASELIHEVIVAMNYRATVADFMRIPHLHPTLSEIWTYPAEICAARCGLKEPGDESMEVATSGTAAQPA